MKPCMSKCAFAMISISMMLGATFASAGEVSDHSKSMAPTKGASQKVYSSPEDAAKDLYHAVKAHDIKSVYAVLGPGSAKLIYTGDMVSDEQMGNRFIAAYDKSLKVEHDGDAKATLLLGEKDFPFPYPIVKVAKGWRFDSKAGAEEIINRRVGANELFAIKTCLAIGDAQREYAERKGRNGGLLEYARKFRSSKGKQDGLYWDTAPGEPDSPLGPLAARAVQEGYSPKAGRPTPYHGYYYRILTGQGKDAPGGAYNYVVKGHMIGGYAVVAYPSSWGSSGVMTFTCSHDGDVYQKNLGPGTAAIAKKMKLFNPDSNWSKAEQ